MADVTLNIRHNASQAAPAVGQLADEMGRMAKQSKSAATAGTAAANGFKKIGAACLNVGKSAKTGASGVSKLVSSLGRIAFYRAIRSAIRYVTDSFKQGLEAAYNWSKEQGGANAKLAGAMDALSAASGRMKLQLGAAFGGLIVAIEPILIRIINLVTQAAEAITRFFAVLNGSGYYKKAASGFEEVGNSAGGAGKKIKGLLASWDELNVIGKESGGGGGGSSAVDYSGAYEWVPAQSELATAFLEGNLNKVGEIVGNKLREWGEKIDEWFGKYFGNDYEYWRAGLEGLVDFVSGLLRGMGFDTAADNLELFAEKVKAALGLASEYYNAFLEALENSKLNIIVLSLDKAFTSIKRDFNALCLSIATDIQNSPFLRKIFGDQSAYILKMDAEVSGATNKLETIDKKIAELQESGDNGVNIDAHVNHEKVDKYKETLKKPWAVKTEVAAPTAKLGPEKFFSHGKVVGEGYAYEIIPQLKEKLNISDWLSGNGSGHNDGVYSTGNGLALSLSVIPSLGDRSVFVNDMDKNITGRLWYAPVNPRYNTMLTDFLPAMERAITDRLWYAPVNPNYNSDKTFFDKLKEKITGQTFSTNVNPALKITQTYKDAVGDITEEKTVKIKPELTDAKKFKEQLQSALKASASIKTTVSGTTQTIGKVSMSEYAQGGWPNIGDLFIANEAGPELVGTIGGSTAVANNDDIVQGIQGGVERANSEQNELIRQQNSILMQLLNKELTISPSVALGQVMARSAALYGRA